MPVADITIKLVSTILLQPVGLLRPARNHYLIFDLTPGSTSCEMLADPNTSILFSPGSGSNPPPPRTPCSCVPPYTCLLEPSVSPFASSQLSYCCIWEREPHSPVYISNQHDKGSALSCQGE